MRTTRLFDEVKRETVSTSAGDCEMPIFYRDGSMLTLVYRVDPARAAELVEGPFEPWVVLGKTIAFFCAFEYRETTIGPYGEIGLGILVKRKGTSPSFLGALGDLRKVEDAGFFVTNLPVTTQSAFAAGSELWGYPKYVSPIGTSFEKNRIEVTLGEELVVTAGPASRLRTQGMPLVLYSTHQGRILRTIVDTDYVADWGGAGSVEVTLKNDGPTTRTIRHLGLHEQKPLAMMRTNELCSMLHLGKDMGAWEAEEDRAREAAE